jgi:hypothetical protein
VGQAALVLVLGELDDEESLDLDGVDELEPDDEELESDEDDEPDDEESDLAATVLLPELRLSLR